jgi:carbonic anhydrase/acetyltransferase-like protein (isoleucine patch superfamily)
VDNSNYIAELPFGAPKIDDDAFVAPTAIVVGAVSMGPRSSIWYGAVARADTETIEIGEGSNIQDGCTLHSDPGFPLVVGRDVSVGSIVAAGAVVTQGKEFPPRSVIAGIPAKVVREATDDDLEHIRRNAASYTGRLSQARKVRPVVRRPLPPAGWVPGDAME